MCVVGYFCRRNVIFVTFSQREDVNICFVGYYCLKGIGEFNNCLLGIFGNDIGEYKKNKQLFEGFMNKNYCKSLCVSYIRR